jgi:hypothetical protein
MWESRFCLGRNHIHNHQWPIDPFPKLAYKFFGPYTITKRVGIVAYRLELPADSKIHPVSHISQLKSFTPNHASVYSSLPVITNLQATDVQPATILECDW